MRHNVETYRGMSRRKLTGRRIGNIAKGMSLRYGVIV